MKSDLLKLNRFTTIPFLMDMLVREKLTLLNPSFWEDQNDKGTVEAFKYRSGINSIYALCLTYGNETVHHWNAFANGSSGCCIEFSPDRLFSNLGLNSNLRHGKVLYNSIKNLRNFSDEELPYLKRLPFKTEKEYRLLLLDENPQQPAFDLDINLDVIRRITISNKVPKSVYKSLKTVLLNINPAFQGKIVHSTLFKNQIWLNHFISDPVIFE